MDDAGLTSSEVVVRVHVLTAIIQGRVISAGSFAIRRRHRVSLDHQTFRFGVDNDKKFAGFENSDHSDRTLGELHRLAI